MRSWLRIGIIGAGALLLLLAPLSPEPASGQASDRLGVMVTNLVPLDGADDDFGKDLAKVLRELINDFITHRAIEEKEIRDAARKYDKKMEDLDCILSLQMIAQEVARIAFCGTYTEDREAKTVSLMGVRFVASGTAALEVPDKTWHEDDYRAAAQEIAASFDAFVTQLRNAQFCGDHYEMENWGEAEEKCLVALRIAPNDAQVRLIYAQILRRTDRAAQAYEEVLKVLELQPADNTSLQLAGFLAATLDRPAESMEHFRQLLQLDPGNARVRITIAYDLARDGQSAMAMTLVEEGLELDPAHTDLLLHHGSFAIRAGQDVKGDSESMTLEAAEFYQKGSESYRKAYETLGTEMDRTHLRWMITSLIELDRLEPALELVGQVLETHGEDAWFWAFQGDVLRKLGRLEEALHALSQTEALDPAYQNIKVRQGQVLLELEREDEALTVLIEAVEKGEQSADVIASMFFREAVSRGIEVDDWRYAMRLIEMAQTFESELSERTRGQLDFYFAYSLFSQAVIDQKPENVQSANKSLPKFKEVTRLVGLSHVAAYGRANQQKLYQQLRDQTQQYIAIQDAVIRRGG